MSTLYIANCTRQPHDFLYRVPGEDMQTLRRVQLQRIPAGGQMRIHTEAPLSALQAIIDQHRDYGLMPVDEVVKTQGFVGLCYSFDKPVDLERLQYAFDHNQGVLQERGQKQREDAAVAVDQALEGQIGTPMTQTDVQVLEESDAPSLGAAVQVTHDPAAATPTSSRRRRP